MELEFKTYTWISFTSSSLLSTILQHQCLEINTLVDNNKHLKILKLVNEIIKINISFTIYPFIYEGNKIQMKKFVYLHDDKAVVLLESEWISKRTGQRVSTKTVQFVEMLNTCLRSHYAPQKINNSNDNN